MCTLTDIEPGTELLADYGEQFWHNYALIKDKQSYISNLKKERDGRNNLGN